MLQLNTVAVEVFDSAYLVLVLQLQDLNIVLEFFELLVHLHQVFGVIFSVSNKT